MSKRLAIAGVLVGSAALSVGLVAGIATGALPTGVQGEWEWARLGAGSRAMVGDLVVSMAVLSIYAAAVGAGWGWLSRAGGKVRRWAEVSMVAGLVLGALAVQIGLMWGAPSGYGLTKWATLSMRGASGYFEVAEREMHDTRAFLTAYPEWIQGQDSLHVGTHPPGLFVASKGVMELVESRPGLGTSVDRWLPPELRRGLVAIQGGGSANQRAEVAIAGMLTLLACSGTSAAIYGLVRASGGSPAAAWGAGALWPVVPAAVMFHPAADTAFPLLSASAMAMAVWGKNWARVACGIILGIGMQLTLAFLAVGLIVAVMIGMEGGWRRVALGIGAVGAGFLAVTLGWWAVTGGNPFVTWWWNQANHARFYDEYPRTYWAWVLANPVEMVAAIGPATVAWGVLGMRGKGARAAWPTLAVMVVLTLTGRSLSEVARLWLPFVPALLTASGVGLERMGAKGWAVAGTVGMGGALVVGLENVAQVVYPV